MQLRRAWLKKTNGDQVLTLEWNDLRFWEEDSICSVKVTIELPENDGVAKWRISVSNRSDYWGLWEVACPAVKGFPAGGKYDLATPVTGSGGHLLKNWNGSLKATFPVRFFPHAVYVIQFRNKWCIFFQQRWRIEGKRFFCRCKTETPVANQVSREHGSNRFRPSRSVPGLLWPVSGWLARSCPQVPRVGDETGVDSPGNYLQKTRFS